MIQKSCIENDMRRRGFSARKSFYFKASHLLTTLSPCVVSVCACVGLVLYFELSAVSMAAQGPWLSISSNATVDE